MWWEGNPCNMHLNDLAAEVKAGVAEAGMVGLRFNTIGVSDGISMGTDGMSFSLQSRDIIAGGRVQGGGRAGARSWPARAEQKQTRQQRHRMLQGSHVPGGAGVGG